MIDNGWDGFMDAASEAEMVGMSEATVCRARKDPTHPVRGPHARRLRIARSTYLLAPKDEIVAWWAPKDCESGRPVLSPLQWRTLREVVAGCQGMAPPRRVMSILRSRGFVDGDGLATDAGRTLVSSSVNSRVGRAE